MRTTHQPFSNSAIVSHPRTELLCLIFLTLFMCFVSTFMSDYQELGSMIDRINLGLILTIGLLHGSFDIFLKIKKAPNEKPIVSKRLIFYLISVFFVSIFFYYFVEVGLVVFILISAYHFGEQNLLQIESKSKKALSSLRLLFGLAILCMLFYTHHKEINTILYPYIQILIPSNIFFISMLILVSLQMVVFFTIVKQSVLRIYDWLLYQIALLSLYWLFQNTGLLFSFTFYFVFWHSIPSIRLQVINNFDRFTFQNLLRYVRKAFLFWIVSSITVLAALSYNSYSKNIEKLLFCFGIALVIPHILLISQMISERKRKYHTS